MCHRFKRCSSDWSVPLTFDLNGILKVVAKDVYSGAAQNIMNTNHKVGCPKKTCRRCSRRLMRSSRLMEQMLFSSRWFLTALSVYIPIWLCSNLHVFFFVFALLSWLSFADQLIACYLIKDCLDQNEASTEKLKHRYDLTTTVELLQYLGFEITSLYELQFLAFLFKYALVQMCKDVYMKLRFHSEEMTESVGREFHPKVVIELVGYVSCQGFLHPLCSKWKNSTSWFGYWGRNYWSRILD